MSKNVRWNPGKDPIPIINDAAQRGVGLAAEHVLGEARKTSRTMRAHSNGPVGPATRIDPNRSTRLSVFDTHYAVDQSRVDCSFRHKKGRKAKYLEIPLNKNKGTIREIVAAAIRKQL